MVVVSVDFNSSVFYSLIMQGLKDGGADILWIETMSSPDEIKAAAQAAAKIGLPYVVTCSFDTAGRTMMGLLPGDVHTVITEDTKPTAMGTETYH